MKSTWFFLKWNFHKYITRILLYLIYKNIQVVKDVTHFSPDQPQYIRNIIIGSFTCWMGVGPRTQVILPFLLIMDTKYFYKVRQQVRFTVQELFKNPVDGTESNIGNIKLKFVLPEEGYRYNPLDYAIEVYHYGRYLESFSVVFYAGNYWGLISEPWIHDYINDIAHFVMDNIDIDDLVNIKEKQK